MKKLRFGVIGCKGISAAHYHAIAQTKNAEVGAVCDIDRNAGRARAKELGVDFYYDYHDLVARDDLDVVSVCTPHYLHHPMAIAALKAGKHVFVEKPMCITVSEADDMVATAKRTGLKIGVCHNARARWTAWAMKRMIEGGELGDVFRILLTRCGLRNQEYYKTGNWRGTWWGEGGGILINQAVHDLDFIQWLAGPVVEVSAQVATLFQRIQTESIASAAFHFGNGAYGVFQASVIDLPGSNYMEIVGDLGTLTLDRGLLRVCRLKDPVKKSIRESLKVRKATWRTPQPREVLSGHPWMYKDFCQAILKDREPYVPPEEGRRAVELVNAILLSSHSGKSVKIPVNRQEYGRLMAKLRRDEKSKLPKWKQPVKAT